MDEFGQHSADDTSATVDQALDAMGAPQYAPPADVTGDSTSTMPDGSMQFETHRQDGSSTFESIPADLSSYSESTKHPDGTTTFHQESSEQVVSGSSTAEHSHTDSYNFEYGASEHRDDDFPSQDRLSPEEMAPLDDI